MTLSEHPTAQIRPGAICAKYIAPTQINGIGIVGTGIQAKMQLKYLKLVTNCREVFVLGRSKEKISKYINDMNLLGFNEMLSKVADAHPRSELAKNVRRRSAKEVKTDEIIKKTKSTAIYLS